MGKDYSGNDQMIKLIKRLLPTALKSKIRLIIKKIKYTKLCKCNF